MGEAGWVAGQFQADRGRLESKPSFGSGLRADFVDGILNLDDRFIVTLDINKVLSVEEMAALVGAAATARPEAAT